MDTSTPVAPPAVPPVTSQVELFRTCIKCSYDLRGLSMESACPECGTPLQESLKGLLLQFADRAYLTMVRGGLSMVLNGILLYIVFMLAVMGLRLTVSTNAPTWLGPGFNVAAMVIQCLILFGYWRYTEIDPGFRGREQPDSARKIVRTSVLVQGGAAVLNVILLLAMMTLPPDFGMALAVLLLVSILLSFAAWIVGFIGIMLYTQWMARRIPDVYIVNRTKTYVWLLPVIAVVGALIIIGPLIALVLYWNLLDRMRKHLKSIEASGVPAALPKMMG